MDSGIPPKDLLLAMNISAVHLSANLTTPSPGRSSIAAATTTPAMFACTRRSPSPALPGKPHTLTVVGRLSRENATRGSGPPAPAPPAPLPPPRPAAALERPTPPPLPLPNPRPLPASGPPPRPALSINLASTAALGGGGTLAPMARASASRSASFLACSCTSPALAAVCRTRTLADRLCSMFR